MWIKGWIRSIMERSHNPVRRVLLLTMYYLAIVVALIVIYGRGDLSSTIFVYQGF
jgi:hypothetical protein